MSCLDWHIGMKVVLREGAPLGFYEGWTYPRFGQVYSIRQIFLSKAGIPCIRLREVLNRDLRAGFEPGFACKWFRPVQTRKTDISVFTALLNGQKQEEPA